MGTWGPKIFQNDDAMDIQDTYRTKLLLEFSDEEAERAIIEEFGSDPDQLFWIPLAVSQWKVGRLSDLVKERALTAIQWEQEHLEEFEWKGKQAEKRSQVLSETRELLCSPMPARKKLRLPWWSWKCPWPVGSVLQLKIQYWPKENNPYLGQYVLLLLVGISEPRTDRLPSDVIGCRVYNWHSSIPPAECVSDILAANPELIPLETFPDGRSRNCVLWDDATRGYVKEYDVQCILNHPIGTQSIQPVVIGGNPHGSGIFEFEESIVNSLKAFERQKGK